MDSAQLASARRLFYPLKVARIVEETHDAKSIVFEIPEALRAVFAYQAGQFLTLKLPQAGDGLRRCYSLASSPHADREHKVTVKRVAGGRASNWVNDRLKVGDVVEVLPPDGRFVLGAATAPLVLFAGGSGITPIISIVKSALATTARPVTLVYANRDARSVIFRAELDALVAKHPGRLTVVHRQDDVHGFVEARHVPSLLPAREVECYLCGPNGFMDAVERGLREAGVDPDRIHIERFLSLGEPGHESEAAAGTSSDANEEGVPTAITIELAGERHSIPYDGKKTLLRTALDAGIDAPYSCEEGICGCCIAQLVEGKVVMDSDEALTKEDKKKNMILTCQSRPKTKGCKVRYLDP